jgi:hypothetical protein
VPNSHFPLDLNLKACFVVLDIRHTSKRHWYVKEWKFNLFSISLWTPAGLRQPIAIANAVILTLSQRREESGSHGRAPRTTPMSIFKYRLSVSLEKENTLSVWFILMILPGGQVSVPTKHPKGLHSSSLNLNTMSLVRSPCLPSLALVPFLYTLVAFVLLIVIIFTLELWISIQETYSISKKYDLIFCNNWLPNLSPPDFWADQKNSVILPRVSALPSSCRIARQSLICSHQSTHLLQGRDSMTPPVHMALELQCVMAIYVGPGTLLLLLGYALGRRNV